MFILLSSYNGAVYLHEQLQSLTAQSHSHWTLYWRDDGSSDATVEILSDFAASIGSDRCVRVSEPPSRIGPTASFITILRAALPAMRADDYVAFADQDDVWLPDKLARGLAALAAADTTIPALYCARLAIVDEALNRAAETTISQHHSGFPAALTQNVATGCTVMLNHQAASLVAASAVPAATLHDWWCYLMVSAAGGRVIVDETVVALYRQHGDNVVGMHASWLPRAIAALRRGRPAYMHALREHVAALQARPDLICHANHAILQQLSRALDGGLPQRLRALRLSGLRRPNALETLLFRVWFLLG